MTPFSANRGLLVRGQFVAVSCRGPVNYPPGSATVRVLLILFHVMITTQETILLAYISIPRHIRKRLATQMCAATHSLRNTL